MLAVALLEGVLVHAAEQGPAITPPAPESLPATYAVVIADRGIPSWFSGIQIRGLRRIERLAEANMVIYIHGGDPNLEWTMMDYDQTVPNRRYRDGSMTTHSSTVSLIGRGQLTCWISVERRSASGGVEPLATLNLARADAAVRWTAPNAWQSYAWLPPTGGPTPAGTASAWGRQAYAEAFKNAEAMLSWQAAHGWKSGEVSSP